MRITTLCVSLLALLAGCSHAQEQTFLLPVSQGPELARQCSRQSFVADSYSKLTAPEASDFEHALRRILQQPANRDIAAVLGPLDQYHRQLIGYMRNGHRYVYANFYVVPRDEAQRKAIFGTEATRAVSVCDGGPRYWGATLDMKSSRITTIDTNGTIGGGSCHWQFVGAAVDARTAACECVSTRNRARPLTQLPKGLAYCRSI